MYNSGKIIAGLIVFILFVTFPFLFNMGKASAKPKPSIDTPVINQMQVKQCVESKDFMRTEHMQLLNSWRDSVVRNGDRIYVNKAGKSVQMSLQNTCMNCHSNKKKFCDECHNYMAVTPYCWTCHIQPKEQTVEKTVLLAPVRIYFDVAKVDLPPDASALLKPIVDFLRANAQAGVDLSGYVDKTGDPIKNSELAKNRAKAVRDMLMSAGVSEAQINMKKPEILTGAGSDVEARRVEVSIASGKGV